MILLTRLNHMTFYLNSDLIETIEETPDTVITLISGKKLLVVESAFEIIERIAAFRSLCPRPVQVKTPQPEGEGL